MATFGRKSTSDPGVGILVQGNQRGSIMGSTPYHAWITSFNGRFGKTSPGAATGQVQWAIYKASNGKVTDFVGQSSGTVPITGVMTSGSGGQEYKGFPAAAIQRWANQQYALMARSASGSFNHGMDVSGLPMHRNVGTVWPSPYTADSADPEGKMSLWTIEMPNTKPHAPSNPTPSSKTKSKLPPLGTSFRDDEEEIPGFGIGQADKLKKFRFKILNEAGTTVLKDSGLVTATAHQQEIRRAMWTPTGSNLADGTYTAESIHYDMFDTPSDPTRWTFTIVSGGEIEVGYPAATIAANVPLETVSDRPNAELTWGHDANLTIVELEHQIRAKSTNALVRGPLSVSTTVRIPGTTWVQAYPAEWVSLSGAAAYRHEFRGKDSNGEWSGWGEASWILVDKAPSVPTDLSPASGKATTSVPRLSAMFLDDDDWSYDLEPILYLGPDGGALTQVHQDWTYDGEGRWSVIPDVSLVSGLGLWNWTCSARDPLGLEGPQATQSTFRLVSPPSRSNLSPANGATVSVPTPTISATIDRTISQWRIYLSAVGAPRVDSGLQVSSSISWTVPAAKLRNDKTYTMLMRVSTSDGLTTDYTTTFVVQYTPAPKVSSYVVAPSAGEFEPSPEHYSEVTASWKAVMSVAEEPTSRVYPFEASLVSGSKAGNVTATGVGAVRYVDNPTPENPGNKAIWLEAGTTNWITNPSFEVDLAGWAPGTNTTFERTTNRATSGTASARITAVADGNAQASGSFLVSGITGGSAVVAASMDVWAPASMVGRTFGLYLNEFGGATVETVLLRSNHVLVAGWQRVEATAVVNDATDRTGVRAYVYLPSARAGDTVDVDAYQLEVGSQVTSYCDGSRGSGYSWSGVAHASSSTRATGYVNLGNNTGVLTPKQGTVILRARRVLSITATDYLFYIPSNAGAGDSIAIQYTTTSKIFVAMKNGANPSRNLATPINSIVPGQWYTITVDWDATEIGVQLDDGARSVIARPDTITSDTFGSTAAAYVGFSGTATADAEIDSLLLFSRKLDDTERAVAKAKVATGTATYDTVRQAAVDESNFGGYIVRRTDLNDGHVELLDMLPARDLNSYIDRTPRSGANYRYATSYLTLVNGTEWVESTPAEGDVSLRLRSAVISDLGLGGVSVPITAWSDRHVSHHIAVEVIETYDELPITFQGVMDYQAIDVDYDILDPEGSEHTSMDVVAAFRDLVRPVKDDNGDVVPKVLCWRDPRRRIVIGSITAFEEQDPHMLNRSQGRIQITENATIDEIEGVAGQVIDVLEGLV